MDNKARPANHKKSTDHAPTQTGAYRPYQDAFNAALAVGAISMLIYGIAALGRNSKHARWRWFAIDLMVQIVSIQLASDLIPHGIATHGQNRMDAGVGVMLMAFLVTTLIGDITGLSSTSKLWYLVDGGELALLLAVLVKYLIELVV